MYVSTCFTSLQMPSKSSHASRRSGAPKPRTCDRRVRVTVPGASSLVQLQSDLADLRQRLDAIGSTGAGPSVETVAVAAQPLPVAHVPPTPHTNPAHSPQLPVCDELLAARNSDSESEGETSIARASKRLCCPTISMAGSLAAAPLLTPPTSDTAVPVANSVDPRLKVRICQGLFVPIEVLLASEQGKPVNHCLKNPFLTPVNDPKLKVYFPSLNIERWTNGFLLFMYIWASDHPEDSPTPPLPPNHSQFG